MQIVQPYQNSTPGCGLLQFPNVMPGLAGHFAGAYSSYLEAPAHFFYMGFLTCLGSVLADRLTLASELAPQPRLYTLLLGESADDRKSTALNKVTEFFHDAVKDFAYCWGVGSAEGLQKRLRESERVLLCFDEFKQFVSKAKIDGSVLLPCVNTLFESNRYESRTKKTDINLERAYLSMLAASTIQTYERVWDGNFTDIGFNNRLFLVPGSGEKKFSIPHKIRADWKQWLKDELYRVLDHVGERRELPITPQAYAVYDAWYKTLERSIHAKRLDTYAMRLMALLAVNERKTEVDEWVVAQAINLANWQLYVRRMHDPIDAENTTARMEQKIRRHLGLHGPLKDYQLKQKCAANRAGLWIYRTAKSNLFGDGEITYDSTSQTYRLAGS